VVNRVDRSKHFKSFDDPFFTKNRDDITIFDFHIHTSASPDSKSKPQSIFEQASKPFVGNSFNRHYEHAHNFLDAIAFTDHDSMKNNGLAAKLAKETGLLQVFGVEFTTTHNGVFPHIVLLHHQQQVLDSLYIALNQSVINTPTFLPQMMRSLWYAGLRYPTVLPLEKVLQVLQDFPEILVIVSHPEVGERRNVVTGVNLKKRRNRPITSLTLDEVEDLLHYNVIDGLEVTNEKYDPEMDPDRLAFCEELNIPGFGFSDAHIPHAVGSVASWVEGKFEDGESLLAALRTQPVGTVMQHVSVKEKSKKRVRDSELLRGPSLQPA